jgi:hypothetical protein
LVIFLFNLRILTVLHRNHSRQNWTPCAELGGEENRQFDQLEDSPSRRSGGSVEGHCVDEECICYGLKPPWYVFGPGLHTQCCVFSFIFQHGIFQFSKFRFISLDSSQNWPFHPLTRVTTKLTSE